MHIWTEKELAKCAKAGTRALLHCQFGKLGLWSWDKGKVEFTWNKDLFVEV